MTEFFPDFTPTPEAAALLAIEEALNRARTARLAAIAALDRAREAMVEVFTFETVPGVDRLVEVRDAAFAAIDAEMQARAAAVDAASAAAKADPMNNRAAVAVSAASDAWLDASKASSSAAEYFRYAAFAAQREVIAFVEKVQAYEERPDRLDKVKAE